MQKINLRGYLKNVAISSNTVYNLIGNFDSENGIISFKENDGTEVKISLGFNQLLIERDHPNVLMKMRLINTKETICDYVTDGFKIDIKVLTKYLDIQHNSFKVKYKIENQDSVEYMLSWEEAHELDNN